jgi:hypothetical protein
MPIWPKVTAKVAVVTHSLKMMTESGRFTGLGYLRRGEWASPWSQHCAWANDRKNREVESIEYVKYQVFRPCIFCGGMLCIFGFYGGSRLFRGYNKETEIAFMAWT